MSNMAWEIKVPIFKNKLILKQLGIAIGIPFSMLMIIMLIIEAYYGVLLVAATLLLTVILVLVLFKGTYDVHFEISPRGILCLSLPQQAKRVKRLSILTVVLGFLAKNPTAAGAGMLSGTKTAVFIPWSRIRKVKPLDNQKCIMIYGGFAENIALFCTDLNFLEVKSMILEKVKAV